MKFHLNFLLALNDRNFHFHNHFYIQFSELIIGEENFCDKTRFWSNFLGVSPCRALGPSGVGNLMQNNGDDVKFLLGGNLNCATPAACARQTWNWIKFHLMCFRKNCAGGFVQITSIFTCAKFCGKFE